MSLAADSIPDYKVAAHSFLEDELAVLRLLSTAMASQVVAVSAPGKVLFAGGFLVLDRQHTGLVFGLDARIHVLVERNETEGDQSSQKPDHEPSWLKRQKDLDFKVSVRSPQFEDAVWRYGIEVRRGKGRDSTVVNVEQLQDDAGGDGQTSTKNKFVETALRYALTYLAYASGPCPPQRYKAGEAYADTLEKGDIQITILADDDYYSSTTPSTEPRDVAILQHPAATASDRRKQFKSFNTTLPSAHKTGLGSSAALTTALVGALLEFYLQSSSTDTEDIDSDSTSTEQVYKIYAIRENQIHNLAQAAHSAAQGKVGSGFDVAAAVYGSCLYRRFSPAVLEHVGEPDTPGFPERLFRCVQQLHSREDKGGYWDVEIKRKDQWHEEGVEVPKGLRLILCDVDCGSETPGMVRKMLQWRKDRRSESEEIWGGLQKSQEELCVELVRLSRDASTSVPVGSQRTETSEDSRYTRLKQVIANMRRFVQRMTASSSVPVEPPPITALLDHVSAINGVIGGVAPGAGGYDAVALLIEDRAEVIEELERSLEGWTWEEQEEGMKEHEKGPVIGKVRLLGVRQASEGVWRENVDEGGRYEGWR
jgi:phosphomevalonate kinase